MQVNPWDRTYLVVDAWPMEQMLFETMPFVMENFKSRKLNPREADPEPAFWHKMHIAERNIPKSKKNMVLDNVLTEGTRYVRVYGGEDLTANYTVYD